MNKILNRFALLLAIITSLSIFAIDEDLFIFAIIAWLLVKFVFLSSGFIEERIYHFSKILKENDFSKNTSNIDLKINNNISENIEIKEDNQEEESSVLEKKWNKWEYSILIWLSVLLNYWIILAGRYLIWENISGADWFLTEWITFFLLILNTIFGIVISLVYKSRTLLVFSFLFAYVNPFIIGADSSWAPYTLVWYSFIISLWALFISKKNSTFTLLFISFVFWNLLFLVAPFTNNVDWSIKIIFTLILSIISIFLSKKTENYWKSTIVLFISTYIFIIFNIFNSFQNFSENIIFSTIWLISIILLIFSYIFSFKKNLVHLFYIWTFWTILTLYPIIVNTKIILISSSNNFIKNWIDGWIINKDISIFFYLSILLITVFAIFNLLLPFLNDKLLKKQNFYSLITWSLAWALFIAFQIYSFWEIHFPWTIEWLAFTGLAILYFLQSYFIIQKIGLKKIQKNDDFKNKKKKEKIKEKPENDFMINLKKVDVSNIKVIRFFPNNWENFTIRASNIKKLTVSIIKQFNKNIFKPLELEGVYNYIIKNYKSELSRREYDKIRSTIKEFIDDGWKVEIVEN